MSRTSVVHDMPEAKAPGPARAACREHHVRGWSKQDAPEPLTIARSQGIHFWDSAGKAYADFASGQISVNVGYNHPKVVGAIQDQLGRAAYVAPVFLSDAARTLASMVSARTPEGLDHIFFTNTGAEGVETAIKVARAVTGRQKIYSAWRSYHGATSAAAGASGDPRRFFAEPPPPGLAKFHFPTCYECPFGQPGPEACGLVCLQALRSQILFEGPETVAAILVEPITGTSGLHIPPGEFIRGLRALCDEHGILLIFDEVMSGWGRTGRWFAAEHFDTIPDILVTAKGITSGYVPFGAVAMSRAIYDHFQDRVFVAGSTTEGHALGCAAGIANLQVYDEEGLIENSAHLGDHLLSGLECLKRRHASVGDVRGRGLFACIQLTADRARRAPLAGYRNQVRDVASLVSARMLELGVFVIAKWDFIFVAPPLIVTRDQIDSALARLDEVLTLTDGMCAA